MTRAAPDAPSVPIRSSRRRSQRSAMAPDRIPRTKKGSIRAPAPTPTMNSEPVSSKISQPTDTCSIPVASEYSSVDAQSSRKSRKLRDTAHLPKTFTIGG